MAEAAPSQEVRLSTPSLIKLVRRDLAAAETAGLEYYEAAGRRLAELRDRPEAKNWRAFLKKHFGLNETTAGRYMRAAARVDRATAGGGAAPRTLSEASGDHRPHHQAGWYDAAREAAQRIQAQRAQATAHSDSPAQRAARQAEFTNLKERANEIIDLGFRAAAAKYHPDRKGGSNEQMARSSKARDRLRVIVKRFF